MPKTLHLRKAPALKLANRSFLAVDDAAGPDTLPRSLFMDVLRLERSRAERSNRRLVLMLVESPSLLKAGQTGPAEKIQSVLFRATRKTDIMGWYRDEAVIGVIFTEFPLAETSALNMLSDKVNSALCDSLGAERVSQIGLSVHVFPEQSESVPEQSESVPKQSESVPGQSESVKGEGADAA